MKIKTKIEQVRIEHHKGVEIKLSRRRGGVGRIDYGYNLPSGVWGTGFGKVEDALEAAKQAIERRKK